MTRISPIGVVLDMKWFKHSSNDHSSEAIRELSIAHGTDGIAIYYHCLELIAEQVSIQCLDFKLPHHAPVIGHYFGISPARVEEVMATIVELGLFQLKDGQIFCHAMATQLEDNLGKSPQARQMAAAIRELSLTAPAAPNRCWGGLYQQNTGGSPVVQRWANGSEVEVELEQDIDLEQEQEQEQEQEPVQEPVQVPVPVQVRDIDQRIESEPRPAPVDNAPPAPQSPPAQPEQQGPSDIARPKTVGDVAAYMISYAHEMAEPLSEAQAQHQAQSFLDHYENSGWVYGRHNDVAVKWRPLVTLWLLDVWEGVPPGGTQVGKSPAARPSCTDVQLFMEEFAAAQSRIFDSLVAQRFYGHYESAGWKIEGKPIRCWQAIARCWLTSDWKKADKGLQKNACSTAPADQSFIARHTDRAWREGL